MKAVRIIVVTLAVVALLAAIAYQLRDRIIRRLSGPYLQAYDIELTDVSLDALSTSDATIRYLELRHGSGARVEIHDLRLPLRSDPAVRKSYAARQVTITPPEADGGEAAPPGEAVRQFLALPERLPNTDLAIAQLDIASYPQVRYLEWTLDTQSQTLSAVIGSLDVHADIVRENRSGHAIAMTIGDRYLQLGLSDRQDAVALHGSSSLQLPATLGLLRAFGELAPQVEVESGAVELQFRASLPASVGADTEIGLHITPTTPLQLVHTSQSGNVTRIESTSASALTVEFGLAELDWTLSLEEASLLVSTGQWQNLPVTLRGVACRSDLSCDWELGVAAAAARVGAASVAALDFSGSQRLARNGNALRVTTGSGATLTLGGLRSPGASAERVSAVLESPADFELDDHGWRLAADGVQLGLETLQVGESLVASVPLSLESVDVSATGGVAAAELRFSSAAPAVRWGAYDVAATGFAGSASLRDDGLELRLSPTGHAAAGEPLLDVHHNLDTESGRLRMRRATLDFAARQLSERLLPWQYPWDVADGKLAADLHLAWERVDGGFQFNGSSVLELLQIAGIYDDSAFAGLSTRLQVELAPEGVLTVAPAELSVRMLDVGLAIEDIRARYTPDPDKRTVRVDELEMRAFGGTVSAEPFSYDSSAASNNLILNAESIELTELLTLQEFEDIELSGTIGARLPVTIEGKSVTIGGGTLSGEAPGGVIRYLPGLEIDAGNTSSIGQVTRALSNFEYETLQSDVDYSQDGDLKLQMRLTGRNPDLEGGRPVILNLGVENNVPDTLRSLQAARSVEEILERRMAR